MPNQQRTALLDAISTEENHVALGKSLQANGARVLNSIPKNERDTNQISPDKFKDAALLLNNATSAITSGVRIETEARERLIRLRSLLEGLEADVE